MTNVRVILDLYANRSRITVVNVTNFTLEMRNGSRYRVFSTIAPKLYPLPGVGFGAVKERCVRRPTTDPLLRATLAYTRGRIGGRVPNEKSPARAGLFIVRWWANLDSNQGPHAYQACALTN